MPQLTGGTLRSPISLKRETTSSSVNMVPQKAILLTILVALTVVAGWSRPTPKNTNWYFAVSGDSRDCGDLIMPKIAQAIADNRKNAPVEFYWHLGDLRAIFRLDCDMAMTKDPSFKCPPKLLKDEDQAVRSEYLAAAWPDFINHQIKPFETRGLPFYLGIGNHELIPPKTYGEFRQQFKQWLTKPTLQKQRASDRKKGITSNDGETNFHFVWKGVDIIYLDNANIYADQNSANQDPGFSEAELAWLDLVLKRDESDPQVKTIIVGMHAALPESVARDHAMDRNCASFCNGKRAYDRLRVTQSKGKKVYVLSSHSHYFEEYIYDTPENGGHGLQGWIIGTAGAEQYRPEIKYGYLLVEVTSDGTIHCSFQRVYSDSVPVGPEGLTKYCFEQNKRPVPARLEAYKTRADCACTTR